MAFDPCNLCCQYRQAALGQDTFRQAVLQVLCGIEDGSITIPVVGRVVLPTRLYTRAFGAITNAYVEFTVPQTPLSAAYLYINNEMNADLLFSLDGITDNFIVKAGTIREYGSVDISGISGMTGLWVKQAVGAPSSGSVYIDGFI